MSGSQLTSSVKRGSPTLSTSASVAGAGAWSTWSRVAQRSARVSSRAPRSSSSASAIARENGSHSRPPRSSASKLLRQLAGDRLEHERAARRPAAPRRRARPSRWSPRRATRSPRRRTSSDGWRSITPLTYGAVASRLRRPPLLRVPVEAAAGDRAHGVDDVGAVGEREHDVLVPVPVGAELDVVNAAPRDARDRPRYRAGRLPRPCGSRASTAPITPGRARRASRSPTRACCAATAASRCCASTAAGRSRSTTTSRGWAHLRRPAAARSTSTRSAPRRSRCSAAASRTRCCASS